MKGRHRVEQHTTRVAPTKHCEYCHHSVTRTRPWHRFCSGACRTLWHAQERRQALAAYRAQQQEDLT